MLVTTRLRLVAVMDEGDEMEALRAIYGDAFSFEASTRRCVLSQPSFRVVVTLSSEYPQQLPELRVDCAALSRGVSARVAQSALLQCADQQGTQCVFALCEAATAVTNEWLQSEELLKKGKNDTALATQVQSFDDVHIFTGETVKVTN